MSTATIVRVPFHPAASVNQDAACDALERLSRCASSNALVARQLDNLQGWGPPVPLFRRLGFRTRAEIARERYALKGIRGDFAGLGLDRGAGCAQRAYDAARPC